MLERLFFEYQNARSRVNTFRQQNFALLSDCGSRLTAVHNGLWAAGRSTEEDGDDDDDQQ